MKTLSLFETDQPGLPTTRDIANRIKTAGHTMGGLPNPTERADQVTYQEVVCRSALNRVKGMPFEWTLNPYRGCTHGCHYCFARRYQAHLELGTGDDFSSVVLVKVNFPSVLHRELSRVAWRTRNRETQQTIAFGTATDPYQPIEGHYRLSRQTLETLLTHKARVCLITKGPMVVRDVELLSQLTRQTGTSVCMSVPTVDEDAWQQLEPGTAHPLHRLRAVRALTAAGVDAGVLMAPIVPGISSHPAKIERTIMAIAEHGARYVGGFVMHLDGGTRDHFMHFLRRKYPHLVERYGRLYAGKYPTKAYTSRVRVILGSLRAKYGLTADGTGGRLQSTSNAERQVGRHPLGASAPADGDGTGQDPGRDDHTQ